MRVDAGQLVHHDAQPLRLRRNIESQQLLHCQHIAEIVRHGAEVVDAIGQRHHLLVELGLAGLLDAGVQVADIRHDANDIFAVDFQNHSQNAVRGRVLRPHIQDHGLILNFGLDLRRRHDVAHRR